jgi:predicted SprT family Zn-dependent metalloprotease
MAAALVRHAYAPVRDAYAGLIYAVLEARKHWRRYRLPGSPPLIVFQRRRAGRWFRSRNLIALPLWLLKEPLDVFEYYVAHEVAHAISRRADHGPEFQRVLWRLAGVGYGYEEGYKPRRYADHMRAVGWRFFEREARV